MVDVFCSGEVEGSGDLDAAVSVCKCGIAEVDGGVEADIDPLDWVVEVGVVDDGVV